MKSKLLLLFLIGLSVILLSLPACSSGASIPWVKDYSGALERARSERLPVITYLFTDWCSYCKQMEGSTFQDPLLTEQMSEKFVWVKLNAETDEQGIRLRDEYLISGYPTFLVLDAEGRELDRMEGYIPAAAFKSSVEGFLTSPNSFAKVLDSAERNKDLAEPQYNLAHAYMDRNNFPAAIHAFEQAIEKANDEEDLIVASSYYYLSYVQAASGRAQDAISSLDQLETRFPETPVLADAFVLKGQILTFEGRNREARKVLTKYLETFPDHGHRSRAQQMLRELQADSGFSMATSH